MTMNQWPRLLSRSDGDVVTRMFGKWVRIGGFAGLLKGT
jgi:hypothetical protein